MKKYLFLLVTLLITLTSFAQEAKKNKVQRKAQQFAEVLASKYDLDEAKTASIYELKLDMMKKSGKLNKQKKSGEITVEEAKETAKGYNKEMNKKLIEICSVTDKKAFYANQREANQAMKEVQ